MATEKRLIDANALMDAFRRHMVKNYDRNKCTLEENCKTCEPGCLWRRKVSEAPTVDAVEVVHGHWCWEGRFRACSKCGSYVEFTETLGASHWKYCPNCGAKMDGGNEDGTA